MTALDEQWMRHAIRLAQRAEDQGEVPVGALVVHNEQCIAEGWNQPINLHDASAHAEIDAIRKAGIKLQNYRLLNTTLYVTLEPCIMCIGAIAHARINRLVFGAYDKKRGVVCSALQLEDMTFLNHKISWQGGIFETECATLLQDFFRNKRKKTP